MRNRWISSCLLGAGLALLAGPAWAQDKPEQQQPGQEQMSEQEAKENAAWEKAAQLTENHARLGVMIGTWKATAKFWMPGMPEPIVSKGTNVNKWLFDKRYVRTEYEGEFMGMPYYGGGLTGYDNVEERYFSTWVETMSTGHYIEYGQYDEASKTYTYMGEMKKPTGERMKTKSFIKVFGPNDHVLTMYEGETADDMHKIMEIVYERDESGGAAQAAPTGAAQLVSAGCGQCIYKMDGVKGCTLAVKIDGKAYLVKGAKISAHAAGLCGAEKQAKVVGEVKDDVFVAKEFDLQ